MKRTKKIDAGDDDDEVLSLAAVDQAVMELDFLGKLTTEEFMLEIRCHDELFKALSLISAQELLPLHADWKHHDSQSRTSPMKWWTSG